MVSNLVRPSTEAHLARICRALLDEPCGQAGLAARVRAGEDPLGEAFCQLRARPARWAAGAFYTPPAIVEPMVRWVLDQRPARVIDAGCGSGRFSVALRRAGFEGSLVAVDNDPLAALMTRAHLAAAGCEPADVRAVDFTRLALESIDGPTAFIGNPPYLRHHALSRETKAWAQRAGAAMGLAVSGLAGLHALFLLAVAGMSRVGDLGCFVTSSEWLDTSYGGLMRSLLAGPLGLVRLSAREPENQVFHDAMTTAAVFAWLHGFTGAAMLDRPIPRDALRDAPRWSLLLRPGQPVGDRVPLGSLARVHRGVATGANDFFALPRERATALGVARWTSPCLTRARQVIDSPGVVRASTCTHVLLDLDADLPDEPALRAYLASGKARDVHQRYLCRHRRPWWKVGGKHPPPIVATYMARRPPAFALNPDGCRTLNVLHGIYPHEALQPEQLEALVRWLNTHAGELRGHRTYHGGLQKWEPGDLETALIPPLDSL